MAKSKQNTKQTEVKEVKTMEPKYYTAYPAYTETEPKKIKGLVLPIDGRTFYINLISPVITEKKQGDRIIYCKKEFNVMEITQEDTKATETTKDKAI